MNKKNVFFVLFICLLLFPINLVRAVDSRGGYYIDSYNVDVIVNENNTLNIAENIGVVFNEYRHGIFRRIPLVNKITRLDGTTSRNRVRISNLKVSDRYKISTENSDKVIKIGDPDKTIIGHKDYSISYLYDLGKDPSKDYDELYFNLIGTEWDTTVSNITFHIVMPKEFDASKLGFSSGAKGSINSANIIYNVDSNVITGKYNGTLNKYEGLTVRLELPDGYFVGAGFKLNIKDYIMMFIPVIFLLFSILLWYKFGKDDMVVETVEFYPPEGLNSLEAGFLYNGKANNKDVTSLLIYLANKGYIKIIEEDKKTFLSKSKSFRIEKLKDYDGNNDNEALFLKGLFTKNEEIDFDNVREIMRLAKESGEKISFTEATKRASLMNTNEELSSVTASDLYDSFYITMSQILASVNGKENKNKIFESNSLNKKVFIILMIIVTFCLITIPPIINYGEPELIFPALVFPGIGFSVLFGTLFGKRRIREKIFMIIWGIGFGGIVFAGTLFSTLTQEPIYLISYIIGILCVFGMITCLNYLSKRTEYGNQVLGKLKGFKNFLETAEKENLESMVMKDPTYFYNILPYTYVLGVSDKWIEKFETINMMAPSWYEGTGDFDVVSFNNFMNDTMDSASSAMSSSPSSDTGGGSSGGGSGGGGGGSW